MYASIRFLEKIQLELLSASGEKSKLRHSRILGYSVTFTLVMSIFELVTRQTTEDPIFLVA
jgi:hypothetical protein